MSIKQQNFEIGFQVVWSVKLLLLANVVCPAELRIPLEKRSTLCDREPCQQHRLVLPTAGGWCFHSVSCFFIPEKSLFKYLHNYSNLDSNVILSFQVTMKSYEKKVTCYMVFKQVNR